VVVSEEIIRFRATKRNQIPNKAGRGMVFEKPDLIRFFSPEHSPKKRISCNMPQPEPQITDAGVWGGNRSTPKKWEGGP